MEDNSRFNRIVIKLNGEEFECHPISFDKNGSMVTCGQEITQEDRDRIFNQSTLSILQERLKVAIEEERYEDCAMLQKQIREVEAKL